MLPDGVTLADIAADLSKPERYVRLALANMLAAEKEHGPLALRIGKMGTGQIPHYRLDTVSEIELLDASLTHHFPVQSFNGRNHLALVTEGEESDILREEHWSQGKMTCLELAELLGQIRAKGRRR
ncbi:hypothetical protein [Sphingomonas sp. SRS2]|uniref:hypothetical protein n=1 Tax=Sphingomonas sp. SRS2 TaxID=133190 RepID=UPI0006184887|nr:hypothetical protein [Sphingomonas sp. SRS2]KKC24874.1 hypothetical protein WP12_16730 [Sphingomonas sp. SRS2]